LISLFRQFPADGLARLRPRASQRAVAVALALLVEALLMLAILSLGLVDQTPPKRPPGLVSVDITAPPQAEQAQPEAARKTSPLQQARDVPPVPVPSAAPVTEPPPAIIPLSRSQLSQFDIATLPRQSTAPSAPPRGNYGPPDLGVPGDSKRVGSAPNGQPMYAASWYREPYDSELAGYLSTATGPGSALIACRTAPDFRVEDCVGLSEYPQGSNIQRAVLAAAWQFKVRPPRVGGVSKIGEWVRIRIDYDLRPAR
jgi:protein TonB